MGKFYKYFFCLIQLLFVGGVFAQPTDLIISEYIEGASNDKCIEIYNGTGAAINLNGYSIRVYSNGSATVSATVALPNVILNNCDVYVVCNTLSQASLLAIDDMSSANVNFNGDDAVDLFNGTARIDLIGNIGCDPGSEWTGVTGGTADNVIRRQSNYCSNISADEAGTCPWTAFTAANWTSTNNTTDFSDLGTHTSSCALCSTNSITTSVIAGSPFSVTCSAGTAVNVDFTSVGTFTAGNIYTAELSDAAGSFAFPTPIGNLSSTANAGTINATIPANTPTGAAYRIRVVSDSPITTGTDNGTNLTINLTGGSCGISTSAIVGSPFSVTCGAGAAVNVDFTSIGTFNVGNIYTAQLSNSAGSFASPVVIGTLSSTSNSGTIASTIPAGTLTGAGYRIRVISSSPVYTGTDNGSNLTINLSGGPCVSGISTGAIAGSPFVIDCNTFQVITVPFTATGNYNVGNIFRAQLSDASGSFAFPITIGELTLSGLNPSSTIPSTIFAGLTPGTNYRIRVVSTNPVNTGTDNGTNLTVTNASAPCYGPIIVNEISQGASGNYEYMEFLVIANDPCATMDIRNFVLDDNNGDFSGGPTTGVGIAAGHVRLTNSNQWANVPSGSLIVVYNNIQRGPNIPADDPSDLLVPDKVYILPVNSSLLEGCVTRPTSSDNSYSPCTYGVGDWAYISMANAADAVQVRYPNYTYSHGFSWGGAPMNGGPDGLNIGTGTTSNTVIEFENTTNNSYTTAANFTRTTVASGETPGAPNSVNNSLFIATLTCVALPVELLDFNVIKQEKFNYIIWSTATETNTSHFVLERSTDMQNFIEIAQISASGNSNSPRNYSCADDHPESGYSYYRLKIVDLNGEIQYSNVRLVFRQNVVEMPTLNGNIFNLSTCETGSQIKVFDAAGRLVEEEMTNGEHYSIEHLQNGFYLIHITCNRTEYIFKTSLQK
jgi:hypothetical protein